MKPTVRKTLKQIVAVAAVALVASGAAAQTRDWGAQWGTTPEEQEKNVIAYNLFRAAYNNENYTEAMTYQRELMKNAPAGHANIYIFATNIYKKLAEDAQTPEEKVAYVDSIMMMYDRRAEAFAEAAGMGKPYILRKKAEDYIAYRPQDTEGINKAFEDALAAGGENTPADFINLYFNEITQQYKAETVDREAYLEDYDRLETMMNTLAKEPDESERNTLGALLVQSGAADCGAIEQIYKPRVDQNPDDADAVKKAAIMAMRGRCKGEFADKVIEKYFENEKSVMTAYSISGYYQNMEDYDRALKYLRYAYENDNIENPKEQTLTMLAGLELKARNYRAASDLAKKGIETTPTNGNLYLIWAQSYVEGAGCAGFDRQSVYWLAADILARGARSTSDTKQLDLINRSLGAYYGGFPSKEECFFRGLTEGSAYTVKCGWVVGTTTVRTNR